MKYFLINIIGDVLGIIIIMDWFFNSNKFVFLFFRLVLKVFLLLIFIVVKFVILGRCFRGLWGILLLFLLWFELGSNFSSRDLLFFGRDFLLFVRFIVCDNKLKL